MGVESRNSSGPLRARSPAQRRVSRAKSGFSLLEVMIALAIVSTVLMASAGAFLTSLKGVHSARQNTRASVFLQTVLEDVSAQPYDTLPTFNGNHFYDQAAQAQSKYSVTLNVFLTAVDLQQITAVLTDLKTNKVIGRVSTYRSRT